MAPDGESRALDRCESWLAVAVTVVGALLHAVSWFHAGALWRDEAGIVALASADSIADVWRLLNRDSFPLLFPLLLRAWQAIGLDSDFALRGLGCAIGLALLASVWYAARAFGRRVPLVALTLLAVNPHVGHWGDSLRAYGLGCALLVLAIVRMWALGRRANARNSVLAAAAAIAAVQCLYQNAALIAAVCATTVAIAWVKHERAAARAALAVGAVALLSVVPYAPLAIESQQWFVVQQVGFSVSRLPYTLHQAMGPCSVAWLLALAPAAVALVVRRRLPDDASRFGAIALAGCWVGFACFLAAARLPTQVWYWLPLLAGSAVCLEAATALHGRRARVVRLVAVGVAIAWQLPAAWTEARCRQTNVDLVAAHVASAAAAEDLVVVHPWYCGITFARYYRGRAPWTTLPELGDHSMHRYDLLRERLAAARAGAPVIERAERTLRAGGRVFLVGPIGPPRRGDPAPADPPPAPSGPHGWNDNVYSHAWGRQLGAAVAAAAKSVRAVEIAQPALVNAFERTTLSVASGLLPR